MRIATALCLALAFAFSTPARAQETPSPSGPAVCCLLCLYCCCGVSPQAMTPSNIVDSFKKLWAMTRADGTEAVASEAPLATAPARYAMAF